MRDRIIKLVAVLAVLCLLFGCSKKSENEDLNSSAENMSGSQFITPSGEISLAFIANDSLDPYEAKSKSNQEIDRLMYDGLVRINNNFEAENVLADKITVSGTSVVVKLRSDARFTDGTVVTAEDAAYSISKAKSSEGMQYFSNLSNINSYKAEDQNTLSITLSNPDDYFENFLDFPIIKKGTDGQKNSDKKAIPPIGSGRYGFKHDGGSYSLEANTSWIGGSVRIAKINLVNLPDNDAISHAVSTGRIDIYYSDLTDNSYPAMQGSPLSVNMLNLVYLGVNTSGAMKNEEMRRAVSSAIDREDVVESVFFGSAVAAKGVYHSNYLELSGLQTIDTKVNVNAALESLKLLGYNKLDNETYAANGSNHIKLKIIYYSGSNTKHLLADKLVSSLKTVGIEAVTEGLDWDKYQSYIQNGYYDLYIGEIRIPSNLDVYSLITAGGLINPNLSNEEISSETESVSKSQEEVSDSESVEEASTEQKISAQEVFYNIHIGKGSVGEVISCLNGQLPVIPICHRNGVVIYSSKITEGLTPTQADPFCGIENCSVK